MSRVLSFSPRGPLCPTPLPLDLSDPLILRRLFPQPDSRNAIQHWENKGLGMRRHGRPDRQPPGSHVIGRFSVKSCAWETPASSSCSRSLSFLQEGADIFVSLQIMMLSLSGQEGAGGGMCFKSRVEAQMENKSVCGGSKWTPPTSQPPVHVSRLHLC